MGPVEPQQNSISSDATFPLQNGSKLHKPLMPKTLVAAADRPPSAIGQAGQPSDLYRSDLYRRHVNPQWVKLLDLLKMNVRYERCEGVELFTNDGRRLLDFLSGYCVHNTGHNHPRIIQALKDEMDKCGPAMLQSHVPEIAGELARRLCELAGGGLKKVYFGSSGSEGVEAAIKFARATTDRAGIVYAKSSFHGLTTGALSLMSDGFWRDGFGPFLPDTQGVPFGDITALESVVRTKRHAAFVVEPLQAEGGIRMPTHGY